MFDFLKKQDSSNFILDAINRSRALIEFDLNGIILDANSNFLNAMGYSLEEIKGQHHRIFVDPDYAESEEYAALWDNLRAGNFESGEYKRFGKDGREVWIYASYNPLFDNKGKQYGVIKFASDITEQKLQNLYYEGQINAINRSQAVIEFEPDGTIICANHNFLNAMGYSLEEIKGQHHRMFVDPDYAESEEYAALWDNLRTGNFESGEYKRFGKDGREVWIYASYNPIVDTNGDVFKVVKFASDITEQKLQNADARGQLDAINRTQAVIEFNLDGSIITANQNFLEAMGYSLDEVKGKHHSIFVDPGYAESEEYRAFWKKLAQGEFETRVYKRFRKDGSEIYIQASYNPIFDMNGKPFKVVKFATDVSDVMKTLDFSNMTSDKMQSVASAIEQLSASVGEINNNMAKSSEATAEILSKIHVSNDVSQRLIETMQSTEAIVSLIRDIAEQVNLLALNATIEAARAGDAGKGFAVVASEVKGLASQTSQATDEIAEKISSVQLNAGEVAKSIQDIVASADLVNEYVNNAAGITEEQSSVTLEISASTQEASQAVKEISTRIQKLSEI